MKKEAAYLDYNATARTAPVVAETVVRVMNETGNASSVHAAGRRARTHIETAREQVAALVGSHANQVVFTSGATESNNAVLKHFAGQRLLISAIEHPSVLESAPDAEKIPVTKDGVIDLAAFESLLKQASAPALVSVMLVNNETGVIQPVAEMARLAKNIHPGIFIHTDAVQAAGRIPFEMAALYVDYLSLSAHKIGGPQGVGALIVAPGTPVTKFMHGGGQEKRQRAGTENVAGIAGFGAAAAFALSNRPEFQKLSALRDRLEKDVAAITTQAVFFGQNAPRVANTSNFALPNIPAQTLLMALDLEGINVSSGSACSSGTVKASPVLEAMGAGAALSGSSLRISMGWATGENDIDRFVEAWKKITQRF